MLHEQVDSVAFTIHVHFVQPDGALVYLIGVCAFACKDDEIQATQRTGQSIAAVTAIRQHNHYPSHASECDSVQYDGKETDTTVEGVDTVECDLSAQCNQLSTLFLAQFCRRICIEEICRRRCRRKGVPIYCMMCWRGCDRLAVRTQHLQQFIEGLLSA